VTPVLGERQIQKITADQLAALIGSRLTSRLAPWTIRGIITPLRRVFSHTPWIRGREPDAATPSRRAATRTGQERAV